MKKIIVVIPEDYINSKKIAKEIFNKTYADISNVKVALDMLLEKEEGEKVDAPTIYTLDNFLMALNDQSVNIEASFITKLNIEM